MPVYTCKKTGRYFVQFGYLGTTYKFRLKAGMTKSDARRLEAKKKSELFFEAHRMGNQNETLYEDFLIQVYLPHVESNRSEESFKRAVIICKLSLVHLKGKSLRSIKAADLERVKSHLEELPTKHGRKRMPATVARDFSVISKAFSLAVLNDEIDYNPCARVEKPKFDNVQDRVLRPEDEESFFAGFQSEWARDVCKVILNTGLRQKDVLGLSKFQVNWATEEIVLIQAKTKRRVVIPMNSVTQEVIRSRWNNGSELVFPSPKTGRQGSSIRTAMKGAAKRAGLEPMGSQIARRTYGTRLHELGFDDSTVAQLLGHTDLRSITRYKRGTMIKRQAVESLVPGSNPAKNLPVGVIEKQKKSVNG